MTNTMEWILLLDFLKSKCDKEAPFRLGHYVMAPGVQMGIFGPHVVYEWPRIGAGTESRVPPITQNHWKYVVRQHVVQRTSPAVLVSHLLLYQRVTEDVFSHTDISYRQFFRHGGNVDLPFITIIRSNTRPESLKKTIVFASNT